MVSENIHEDVTASLRGPSGLGDLLEMFNIFRHAQNHRNYICFSGPDPDPSVKRKVKFKDCIATEGELFSRGRERDELLVRAM